MFADHPKSVLLLGVLGISISAILVRYSQAPSVITAVYRLGWTVLLLLPAVLTRFRAELKRVRARDAALCTLSGICLALHFLTWFESLKWTGVAVSTVLVSTEVIFTALGFALFLKGKIPPLGVAAILLAFGGSAVLALAGGGTDSAWYGNLLALAAAFFVALYTLIGRIQRGYLSTTVYTFLTYLVCFLTLLLLALFSATPLTGYGVREWLIGLGLAVFCTLLGHSVFSWGLKYEKASYISTVKFLEPVFASVWGILFLQEVPSLATVLGGAVILGGVVMYSLSDTRQARIGQS